MTISSRLFAAAATVSPPTSEYETISRIDMSDYGLRPNPTYILIAGSPLAAMPDDSLGLVGAAPSPRCDAGSIAPGAALSPDIRYVLQR